MDKIIEMKHISKYFPGVKACDDINLDIERGEVHALLGENGAGKTTLMNILCGLYKQTDGEIWIDGEPVRFTSAKDAMAIGIGMVHQHFMLIPSLTVAENCLIGNKSSALKIDIKRTSNEIESLADQYNMPIDPNVIVSSLSVGEMQRVEIIKTLYRGANILILDEPTAVLTPQETQQLFSMIRNLTAKGYTVLFISHKLNEVKEISDRVTVLRHGKIVGTFKTSESQIADLARHMIGRPIAEFDRKRSPVSENITLKVRGLTYTDKGSEKALKDIDLDIRSGEILGIAGVDGNGQTELIECLTGMAKAVDGIAQFNQLDLLQCKTREIMQGGVSHIPQDRQRTGLVLSMPLTENFVLQDYYSEKFGKFGIMNWRTVDRYSDELIEEFDIRTPDRNELAQNLSGGNQQKVVVAREINREHSLLIAMHPTRGLDIGAIEFIHNQLIKERENGRAILLISTELEELMKLSDRISIMFEGKILGTVDPDDSSIEKIGLMLGGASEVLEEPSIH